MFREYFIPGATAVGLTFDEGVVLGAEKRFAYGTFVISRAGKKVFRITDRVGAACAGMVADMQILVREIEAHIKIRELQLGRPVPSNSVAKLMSVLMFERRYTPLLTQVVIGGVDTKPSIYVLDPLGSVIEDIYAAVGSGAEIAIGVLESEYRKGMKKEEAKELAIKSIRSAVQRDAASGDGVDIMIITKSGIEEESKLF
ncbi:MAG: archaeal proteasome endopeptidase complex subunit beta [Nitrososphaerota archaeon]|nr:archaeal proteasome endopeptidase complex subunit beta [Nitrososphaerales archaeon]MDW8044602.1 archaeal proteasome endopeptidase complex subunit beta [Nitrososphaerota archaeon]